MRNPARRFRLMLSLSVLAGLLWGSLTLSAPPPGKGGGSNAGPAAIAYAFHGPTREIRTVDLNGDGVTTVVSGEDILLAGARWSPDGTRLGGYEIETGTGLLDIALASINADGTDERIEVSYADVDALNVANGKIGAVDAQDLDPTFGRLTWGPAADWGPAGQYMVFSASAYEQCDAVINRYQYLYLVDLSDGSLTQLTPDEPCGHDDILPHWSPALDMIVFTSDRSGIDQLWVINPDGTGLRQLTDFVDGASKPTWSSTGDAGLGQSMIHCTLAGTHVGGVNPVGILDIDLGLADPVVTVWPGIGGYYSAWSPDDREMVFTRSTPGRGGSSDYHLIIVDLATGDEREILKSKSNPLSSPDWNPTIVSP